MWELACESGSEFHKHPRICERGEWRKLLQTCCEILSLIVWNKPPLAHIPFQGFLMGPLFGEMGSRLPRQKGSTRKTVQPFILATVIRVELRWRSSTCTLSISFWYLIFHSSACLDDITGLPVSCPFFPAIAVSLPLSLYLSHSLSLSLVFFSFFPFQTHLCLSLFLSLSLVPVSYTLYIPSFSLSLSHPLHLF